MIDERERKVLDLIEENCQEVIDFLLSTTRARALIDCGLYQGDQELRVGS